MNDKMDENQKYNHFHVWQSTKKYMGKILETNFSNLQIVINTKHFIVNNDQYQNQVYVC